MISILKTRIERNDTDTLNWLLRMLPDQLRGISVIGANTSRLSEELRRSLRDAGVIFTLEDLASTIEANLVPNRAPRIEVLERLRDGVIEVRNIWQSQEGRPERLVETMVASIESFLRNTLRKFLSAASESERGLFTREIAGLRNERETQRLEQLRNRNEEEVRSWLNSAWLGTAERLNLLSSRVRDALCMSFVEGAVNAEAITWLHSKNAEVVLEKFLNFNRVVANLPEGPFGTRFNARILEILTEVFVGLYGNGDKGLLARKHHGLFVHIRDLAADKMSQIIRDGGRPNFDECLRHIINTLLKDWQGNRLTENITGEMRAEALEYFIERLTGGDGIIIQSIKEESITSLINDYRAGRIQSERMLGIIRAVATETIGEIQREEARNEHPDYDGTELLLTAWRRGRLPIDNDVGKEFFRLIFQSLDRFSQELESYLPQRMRSQIDVLQAMVQLLQAQNNDLQRRIVVLERPVAPINPVVPPLVVPQTAPLSGNANALFANVTNGPVTNGGSNEASTNGKQ